MLIKEERLDLNKFPRLPCPTCDDGILEIIKETATYKHPSYIKRLPKSRSDVVRYEYENEKGKSVRPACYDDIMDTPHEKYITSFFLECDRRNCQEVVSTCGETKKDEYFFMNGDEPNSILLDYYFPKFFFPTIRLINLPEKTPKKVKFELEKSFSLFWANPSACANSLRKVIERIMDFLEIPSARLHHRIQKLSASNPDLYTFLMATKWIGNDGSHDEIELKHYDVIIGFKFIEQCLIELFENQGLDLNSIALKINTEEKALSKINS